MPKIGYNHEYEVGDLYNSVWIEIINRACPFFLFEMFKKSYIVSRFKKKGKQIVFIEYV